MCAVLCGFACGCDVAQLAVCCPIMHKLHAQYSPVCVWTPRLYVCKLNVLGGFFSPLQVLRGLAYLREKHQIMHRGNAVLESR